MGTFFVGLIVFGGLALICRNMWRRHKIAKASGQPACCGSCGDCGGCAASLPGKAGSK